MNFIADVLVPYGLTVLTIVPFVLLMNFVGLLVKNSGILICIMFVILGISKFATAFMPSLGQIFIINYFKQVIFEWRNLNYIIMFASMAVHFIILWFITNNYFKNLEIQK
jgi:hypothetical protein